MDAPVAKGAQRVALEQWGGLITKCLSERVEPEKFESYVPFVHLKYPLPPLVIADLFLRPQLRNHDCLDPRIPRYLQVLTNLRYIDTPSVLAGLYRYSTSHVQSRNARNAPEGEDQKPPEITRWRNSYGSEEVLFYRLTKAVVQGTGIQGTKDGLETAQAISKWMTLFTDASTAFTVDAMGDMQANQARDEMESARAAFVALLLAVCESQAVLKALSGPNAKATRRAMSESLSAFVPTIMHAADRIANRLDLFRTSTLAGFEPVEEKKQEPNTELDNLFDGTVNLEHFVIPDIPIVPSRAGLYIHLNAALIGRPLVDDVAILSYLNNRYQGDVQSATVDLILASFDVLANAVFRNEGKKTAHLLRSYLMNKLPLLIVHLSKQMFPPLTPQYCITDALRRVDTNTFPTLSSIFDDSNEGRSNNSFTDSVREDFCWACCLHGLLPADNIKIILNETPYSSLPPRGRYIKENLVTECLTNTERIVSLVEELDNMDGNVGATCQALVELLGQFCRNKETMSLKTLCGQLSRKPLSLDVLLLFEKPSTILHPLCELLDNWKYEEDQGEYQPVYEEFGSVLLLLLALAYRYNLGPSDVGVKSPDSFVAKLLVLSHQSRPADDLSEQEKGQLDGWIRGLFDQEAGGLTDDLISSCPPQEFYLLVPTLFQNIVIAVGTGNLSEESLKGGVEYLVDTFLLPSLVPAITYLANLLWVDRQHQKAILRILHFVVNPSAISSDASAMLSSVLNIVAKPLEHSLRAYQRQDPKSQEVEPLLRTLKDSIPLSRRTGGADQNELENWSNMPNGGLTTALRHTIHGFVQWGLQAGINVTPTSYTHRQILAALRMLGAKRVLHLIYEEVRQQSEAGNSSIAYDIAIALICAADVTNSPQVQAVNFMDEPSSVPVPTQRRLSLRDVLRSEAEDCRKLQKTDMAQAELVVRLHRRVEGQMVISQPAETLQAGTILQDDMALGLDGGAASLDSVMAAAAAVGDTQNGGMVVDNVSLDMGMGGMGGDLGLDTGGAGVSLDMGEDMFSGLSAGGDFDWDSMDLS